MKYNYLKASKIWDEMIEIMFDMPDYLDTDGRQRGRRVFLRALTRNDKRLIDGYLEDIHRFIFEVEPTADVEKELKRIALLIVFFTNENNY